MKSLPPQVGYVLETLRREGHEAYIVGGAVRDLILGRTPDDFDVATDAVPEETLRIFRSAGGEAAAVPTGAEHGTVTVAAGGGEVQVTTYRSDSAYADCRHPDSVSFGRDIREDLARRDFTMNAIAWDGTAGEGRGGTGPSAGLAAGLADGPAFVDPYGGMADIRRGIIRAVGEPARRFGEDALRIMRAIRFASELGFRLEAETEAALFKDKGLLGYISAERLRQELVRLLCGEAAETVLRRYAEIIGEFIPEILPMVGFDQKNPHHAWDVWEHTIRAVSGAPPEPALRLAALFHDIGKPGCFTSDAAGVGHFYGHAAASASMAGAIMRRLKFDNRTREYVVKAVAMHDYRPEASEKAVRRLMIRLAPVSFGDFMKLKRADNRAQAPEYLCRQKDFDELERIAGALRASESLMSVRDLAVGGDELMALGMSEGPEVGRVLCELFDLVLDGRIANERAALTAAAREIISRKTDIK